MERSSRETFFVRSPILTILIEKMKSDRFLGIMDFPFKAGQGTCSHVEDSEEKD